MRRQEDVGLQSVTDGEFRRATWHMDFIDSLGGVTHAGERQQSDAQYRGTIKNELACGSRNQNIGGTGICHAHYRFVDADLRARSGRLGAWR